MKYSLLVIVLFIGNLSTLSAQGDLKAKKPTVMIVPSNNWMTQKGFVKQMNNQGATVSIYDYDKAFAENFELISVIAKVNGLFQDRNFPLIKLEEALMKINNNNAIDDAITSKKGSSITETKFDKIMKTAKADILIYLSWNNYKAGISNSMRVILDGVDASTKKAISTQQSISQPSASANVDILLEEAVLNIIDNFNAKLQNHFDDMFVNGREVTIKLKKFESWDGDFEKEYGGKELSEIIEDWLTKNSVKGRFTSSATADVMSIEQLRIPMFDETGKPIDARGFAQKLVKFLKESPYNITCKLLNPSLGEAIIVLGEK